jgi:hypothetical protein
MWKLRYLNGFGDLVEHESVSLDYLYVILKKEFDEQGTFAFKLKWEPKDAV